MYETCLRAPAGQFIKEVFRDQTTVVCLLLEPPRFFWSFMANGTFRKWKITFRPEVLEFAALFGEHCGTINAALLSPPCSGEYCKRHTILDHSCFLYTCSDDRTVKVRHKPHVPLSLPGIYESY